MGLVDKGVAPGVQSRFAPDEFTRAIEQHGLKFRWSRALLCTCQLNAASEQYDPTCTKCYDGWLYINPLYRIESHLPNKFALISAVFSSIAFDPTRHEYTPSAWTTGQAVMTVDGHNAVAYRDRFVGIEQRATFTQVLLRDTSDVKVPVGWLGRTREKQLTAFRYEPLEIHYAEDVNDNIFRVGVDFKITTPTDLVPSQVQWVVGRGPADGVAYSVSYDCRPVWVTDDAQFGVQHSIGPAAGISGANVVQNLPRTFKVELDWLTERRG